MTQAHETDEELDLFADDEPVAESTEQDSTESTDGTESGEQDTESVESTDSADEPVELSDEEKAELAAENAAAKKAEEEKAHAEMLAAFEGFKAAVEATLTDENRDGGTGDIPVITAQPVVDAYAALPGAKAKTAARNHLIERMQELMVEGATRPAAFVEARTIMILSSKVKDTKPKTDQLLKPKVDPLDAFAERLAALMLAVNFAVAPEGVDLNAALAKANELTTQEGLADSVAEYRTWLASTAEDKGDAPKAPAFVAVAAKLASGRGGSTGPRKASSGSGTPRVSTAGSGHRGDIGKHIHEAVQSVNIGDFMSIADIAKVATSQYGSDGAPAPSAGAIAARLFPGGDASKCNLDFVRPEGKDEGHNVKGAVRTA